MTNNKEKLNKFINAVNEEIEIKIKSLIDEAQKEKQSIIEAAEKEAQEAAEQYYNVHSKQNSSQFVQELSNAELNAKKDIIQHRQNLADRTFNSVEQRLKEFRSSPKYVDMLIKSLLLMHISDDIEIQLCADDMKYAELIKIAFPTQELKISASDNITLGGLSVYNPSRGIVIDKTFDLSLEEKKRDFVNSNAFAKQ